MAIHWICLFGLKWWIKISVCSLYLIQSPYLFLVIKAAASYQTAQHSSSTDTNSVSGVSTDNNYMAAPMQISRHIWTHKHRYMQTYGIGFCWNGDSGVLAEFECRPPTDIYPWLMRECGLSFGSLMNTVWEVEEPINIWHDSWICLHNWCGNLNWIIIASWWTFRPLSLSHYFLSSFVSSSQWCFSQDQICLLPFAMIFSHAHAHKMAHALTWVPTDNQCDLRVWLTHGTDEPTG